MGAGGGGSGGGRGYSAHGDPQIRSTRRPLYDSIKRDGINVDGKNYKLSQHAYNSMFKSGRKDIMPNDVKDALKSTPTKGTGNSLIYTNPQTGTKVYVNPDTNTITGIQPKEFLD